MATLIPFPTQGGFSSTRGAGNRFRVTLASAFEAAGGTLPENIDWSLMEHLATHADDEGDEPRAA